MSALELYTSFLPSFHRRPNSAHWVWLLCVAFTMQHWHLIFSQLSLKKPPLMKPPIISFVKMDADTVESCFFTGQIRRTLWPDLSAWSLHCLYKEPRPCPVRRLHHYTHIFGTRDTGQQTLYWGRWNIQNGLSALAAARPFTLSIWTISMSWHTRIIPRRHWGLVMM